MCEPRHVVYVPELASGGGRYMCFNWTAAPKIHSQNRAALVAVLELRKFDPLPPSSIPVQPLSPIDTQKARGAARGINPERLK